MAPRHEGLRLLPLPAFIRGGQTLPPRPRARSDHVIIWLTRGRLRLDLPADCQLMAAGDIRHIPAGVTFAATPMQDAQGHVALISARLADIASPSLPEYGLSAHVGTHGPQLLATLSELSAEAMGPDPATTQCLMNLLALRLGQLPSSAPDQMHGMARSAPDRPLVERFLALAQMRLGDCGSVADLAGELGTTSAALDRACIAARGRRAVELLHELRLERAVDLLRHGKQTTSRIAQELGYSSHGHFTRAFVAATGRTPEAFRAQSR
ncbi:helix-turn-helix transcriptional regulator [Paracoccus salsus]|uniref:helix-turn-helix transcriptional regulator n=1 Tax=Paracoccus salsus TaxID=2911061 RepID=UPI001F384611|nr:AraC family transcriptional regulator [Paracoccus salsus]MCF3974119.1 AraC family transcriptional regulator [Paracoccus salsus]